MLPPSQPVVEAVPSNRWMSYVAWWGGYLLGPLAGLAVLLSEPKGSLNRAHGTASAVLWLVVIACWFPFTFYVIVLGQADESVLLVGLPVVVSVTLIGCVYGSIQAARGRTPSGRRAHLARSSATMATP